MVSSLKMSQIRNFTQPMELLSVHRKSRSKKNEGNEGNEGNDKYAYSCKFSQK